MIPSVKKNKHTTRSALACVLALGAIAALPLGGVGVIEPISHRDGSSPIWTSSQSTKLRPRPSSLLMA